MKSNTAHIAVIDPEGNLKIPVEVLKALNLAPGENVRLEISDQQLHIVPSNHVLSRVYVEPTNRCNLECLTCIRNVWDEPLGVMPWKIYEQILQGIQSFSPIPTLFMGGFGEPLVHPRLIEMIRQAKKIGAYVELITNGVLLSEEIAKQLITAGLDVLWISIDGITPQSYADIRLGDCLPTILDNLETLMRWRCLAETRKPQVGIAFVAMKRNIHELPELIRLGVIKGVERFSISNVLAHTPDLTHEVMYDRTLIEGTYQSSYKYTGISFPRMDVTAHTMDAYRKALQGNYRFEMSGTEFEKSINQCPFIRKRSASIRWDGELSPCLPLLHTHDSYLGQRERRSHAYSIGNIAHRSLQELWNDASYLALREKLQAFDFPPCTYCNSCEMADSNLEDCYGNSTPTCGGCLWAQGLIQCP